MNWPFSSRARTALWLLLVPGLAPAASAADLSGAPAPAQNLSDSLITAMKRGGAMDFTARKAFLAPVVSQDFDLAFMTRIVVGPPWRTLSAADHSALIAAFSEVSIATYASEFKSYGGESFEVDPTPVAMSNGDCVVHTKLHTGSSGVVELDYVERPESGQWKIIDVLLNGSISQMAARRSEYSATLHQGGAAALTSLLRQKAAELGR